MPTTLGNFCAHEQNRVLRQASERFMICLGVRTDFYFQIKTKNNLMVATSLYATLQLRSYKCFLSSYPIEFPPESFLELRIRNKLPLPDQMQNNLSVNNSLLATRSQTRTNRFHKLRLLRFSMVKMQVFNSSH